MKNVRIVTIAAILFVGMSSLGNAQTSSGVGEAGGAVGNVGSAGGADGSSGSPSNITASPRTATHHQKSQSSHGPIRRQGTASVIFPRLDPLTGESGLES